MVNLGYEIFKKYLMVTGNTEEQAERYLETNRAYKHMIAVANEVLAEHKGAAAEPTVEQSIRVLRKEMPETVQTLVNLLEKKFHEQD